MPAAVMAGLPHAGLTCIGGIENRTTTTLASTSLQLNPSVPDWSTSTTLSAIAPVGPLTPATVPSKGARDIQAATLEAPAVTAPSQYQYNTQNGQPIPFSSGASTQGGDCHSDSVKIQAQVCALTERRGSVALLLAAEAAEAAERAAQANATRRENAINLAAMQLAPSSATKKDDFPPERDQSLHVNQYRPVDSGRPTEAQQAQASIGFSEMHQLHQEAKSFSNLAEQLHPEVDQQFREQVYMAARMHHKVGQEHPQQQGTQPQGRSQPGSNIAIRSLCGSQNQQNALVAAPAQMPTNASRINNELLPLAAAPLVVPMIGLSSSKATRAPKPISNRTASGKPRGRPQRHVYHDYASIPDATGFVRKKTGGVTQPFPEKLMDMLDRESIDNRSVVSWLPHGRAFIVRQPKVFTSTTMPLYFRQSKLTSFQRQLNLYGFRRITQGADAGAYYHEKFLRGRPQLSMRMNRQKVKGTGHKQPTDAQSEPNFYGMPTLSPLLESSSCGESSAARNETVESVSLQCSGTSQYDPRKPNSVASLPTAVQAIESAPLTPRVQPEVVQGHQLSSSVFSPSSVSPGVRAANFLKRLAYGGKTPPRLGLGLNDQTVASNAVPPVSSDGDVNAIHGFGSSVPGPPIFGFQNVSPSAAASNWTSPSLQENNGDGTDGSNAALTYSLDASNLKHI